MRTYRIAQFVKTALIGFSIVSRLWTVSLAIEPANQEEEEISKKVYSIEEFDFNPNYKFGVVAVLMDYFSNKGEYPVKLDDLIPYMRERTEHTVRIDDPFNIISKDKETGDNIYGQFRYERKNINDCWVWSRASNMKDENHSKKYNRENGWKSEGDISVHLIRNEEASIGNYQGQAIK